jgi:hypothetical protein
MDPLYMTGEASQLSRIRIRAYLLLDTTELPMKHAPDVLKGKKSLYPDYKSQCLHLLLYFNIRSTFLHITIFRC